MGPHKLSWSQKYYQMGSHVTCIWLAQSWTSFAINFILGLHNYYDSYSRSEPEHFIRDEIKCTIIYLCTCVFFSHLEGIWMMQRRFTFPNIISRAAL